MTQEELPSQNKETKESLKMFNRLKMFKFVLVQSVGVYFHNVCFLSAVVTNTINVILDHLIMGNCDDDINLTKKKTQI